MSVFGPIVSRDQLEQAVVGMLANNPPGGTVPRIIYYIAELERQLGLTPRSIPTPPSTDSYRGTLDYEDWEGAWLPALLAAVQPTGTAERIEDGLYGQWFDITVASVVQADDSAGARQLASWYAAAVSTALLQNGSLAATTFTVDKLIMVSAPRVESLPTPADRRSLARGMATLRAYVESQVTEFGPTLFGPDPYATPLGLPQIVEVEVEFNAETIDGTVQPQAGTTIIEQVGVGEVVVEE